MIFLNPLSPSPLTPMNSALMGAFGWTTDQITLAQATLDSPQIDEENIDLDDGLVTYAYLDDVKSATIAAQESGTDIADFETTIQAIHDLKESWLKIFAERLPEAKIPHADFFFEEKINELVHREAIENERRPDGRKMDELRPLFAKAGGISPILHGSGIF